MLKVLAFYHTLFAAEEGSLLRLRMWQRRQSHLPIHKQKTGLQEQAAPHNAHGWQDAQMFEAQPNHGGTDREDTEQDQAVDATHAALQGIWDNGEAIAAHQEFHVANTYN